jgi:prevent-host-death family protein
MEVLVMENREAHWSVSDAKARFSEILERAGKQPQFIENRGREVAVLLDVRDYRALRSRAAAGAPNARIQEFLRFCREIQDRDGAELELPPREVRSSPFAEEDAF